MEVGRTESHGLQQISQSRISNNKIDRIEEVKKVEKAPTANEVEKKIEGLNTFLTTTGSHLKFQLHEDLNEYYVTIVDETTNEVIKEIPSKKLLDLHAAMKDMIGIMIDKKI